MKKLSAVILFEIDKNNQDVTKLSEDRYGSTQYFKQNKTDYGLLDKEFLVNMQSIESNIQNNPKWHDVCFVDKQPRDKYTGERSDLKCSVVMC